MLYSALAETGVSSFAPSVIQRRIRATRVSSSGSAFCGISTLPFWGVMSFMTFDSSGLPGTMACPSSPPLIRELNSVMM